MRIAIFENIMTEGGHEVDFDRIIVEELAALGHDVKFYVPENFVFRFNYKVPAIKLAGDAVVYNTSRGIRKIAASIKREINRQRWYSQLYAAQKDFDALIVPTSTYRYLRALNHSSLKKISVPLIFILHGINPSESQNFLSAAEKLLPYPNVKLCVLTLAENIFGKTLKNIFPMYPPTYTARDVKNFQHIPNEILTIGFYGQYRREKKLRDLLDVFVNANYSRKVKMIVQGSTIHEEDAADFEKIIAQYKKFDSLNFLHKGLIGADWQRAILNVDALLMPYSSPRYKYHWGGMLFTAIGFKKPVIASSDINPEVWQKFRIGETFESGNLQGLDTALKNFINDFDKNVTIYQKNLDVAAEIFSPQNFTKRLLNLIVN
ncbi:MAG: glycosyltransferase [Selenomonadaceae bacterium]|nr:glycosyltransferase [Selenomonadaceae bacterium]